MKQKSWFKPRAFTHLTKKLSINDARWIESYASNPHSIKRHKFFPLIHRTIAFKRYKKSIDRNGNEVKRHYTIKDGNRKSNVKYREIYYPNHLDAHIYAYYTKKILEPLYEIELQNNDELNKSVLAYRKIPLSDNSRGKCNIDFANDAFNDIKDFKGDTAVLALDISKFFDSLDHKLVKKSWTKLLKRIDLPEDHYNIFKSLTNFSYIEMKSLLDEFKFNHPREIIQKNVSHFIKNGSEFRSRIKSKGYIKKNPFRRNEKNLLGNEIKIIVGIPQGTPMSAFLANLYLLEFDKRVLSLLKKDNGIYRRYSDDIFIICKQEIYNEIEAYVYELIKEFKLIIEPSKTQRSLFKDGKLAKGEKPVAYLGFEFDGKIKRLKSASISKLYRKMKSTIKFRAYRAYKAKEKLVNNSFVDTTLHRKKLYNRFSYLGGSKTGIRKRNYFSYANFATKIMDSPEINKQLSKAWKILHNEIDRNEKKFKLKRISHRVYCKIYL